MRLPILTVDQMTAEQRSVRDATIAGKRGRMSPPVEAWLYSAALAERAQKLGEYIRFDSSLPPALNEMAILMVARHWNAEYEWWAHRRLALAAKLDPTVIDAIRDRRMPALPDQRAKAVYEYAAAMLATRNVTQDLHDAMLAAFDARGVVDLIGVLGYYSLVSMTLNGLAVSLPPGEVSELSNGS